MPICLQRRELSCASWQGPVWPSAIVVSELWSQSTAGYEPIPPSPIRTVTLLLLGLTSKYIVTPRPIGPVGAGLDIDRPMIPGLGACRLEIQWG